MQMNSGHEKKILVQNTVSHSLYNFCICGEWAKICWNQCGSFQYCHISIKCRNV